MSDEQAALIATAMDAQRAAIVAALDGLSRRLGFREEAPREIAGSAPLSDVLRVRRVSRRIHIFVGLARGFTEPAHDARHQEDVQRWLRRFARLVEAREAETERVAGGWIAVGTYDEASAYAWAALMTKLARPHRIQRDGSPVRFVVRRLGAFWMAC